ncbi:MAG: hypothetical protein AB7V39_06010 [Nitrospiraceae bacterium]
MRPSMARLPALPTYAHFVHELLQAGFQFEQDDLTWRHQNGAVITVEGVEDLIAYYAGLSDVFLKILKSGRDIAMQVIPDKDGMGATVRVEARGLLDRIAEETA